MEKLLCSQLSKGQELSDELKIDPYAERDRNTWMSQINDHFEKMEKEENEALRKLKRKQNGKKGDVTYST